MDESDQTLNNYREWQRVYDWFNAGLFNNSLPGCVITFQRKQGAYGYHAASRFEASRSRAKADEIALNPQYFDEDDPRYAISTLVHEMVHQLQWHFGKPSPGGYHNKEWARHMIDIGLVPTDTGEPGGKATGRRMIHFIREGGPFDRLCQALLDTGFVIPYVEASLTDENDAAANVEQPEVQGLALLRMKAELLKKKKAASKSRYTCPGCEVPKHVWGKPELHIICGECEGRFEVDAVDEGWPSLREFKQAQPADDSFETTFTNEVWHDEI
jgi:SprT-like family